MLIDGAITLASTIRGDTARTTPFLPLPTPVSKLTLRDEHAAAGFGARVVQRESGNVHSF